jgi:RNA polymerase sigma-70 factor (ECF subfamily)
MRREEELLIRFASGGHAAGESLIELCGPALYSTAMGILCNVHDAEDAAQDAALKLLRSAKTYRPGGSFRAWLYRIAVNAAMDQLRHRRATAAACAVREETMPRPEDRTPEEVKDAIRAAVARLEEPQRLAVALVYFQGLSRQEAAEVLDLSVNTLSSTLARAKDRLRERLGSVAALAAGLTAESLETLLSGAAQLEIPSQVALQLTMAVRAEIRKAGVSPAAMKEGGLAVKIFAGVMLAGVVAVGAALVMPGKGAEMYSPPPEMPKGPPKLEKFALAVNREYLDGPKMEAMCMDHKEGWPDAAGNIFFRTQWGYQDGGALRIARADGMVETVVGDDRIGLDLGLAEGPASFFPIDGAGISILGAPLEGEDKGAIFASIGSGLYKIYKNKDGRWWFKRQGKAGGQPPPSEVGKSAPIGEIDTTGLGIRSDCAGWKGNIYRINLVKGELTCVLTLADYEAKVEAALKAVGQKWQNQERGDHIGLAESVALSDNGTVFIQYYVKVYPNGRVFRISADRSKVEEVVRCVKMGNKDGPGLETGWHCGPCGLYGARGDCALIFAVDSNAFRRWKDGRVSTLMQDGEWREPTGFPGRAGVVGKGMCIGPPGGLPYVWIPYAGEEMGMMTGIFRFGPVDFTKLTVGVNAGGK